MEGFYFLGGALLVAFIWFCRSFGADKPSNDDNYYSRYHAYYRAKSNPPKKKTSNELR